MIRYICLLWTATRKTFLCVRSLIIVLVTKMKYHIYKYLYFYYFGFVDDLLVVTDQSSIIMASKKVFDAMEAKDWKIVKELIAATSWTPQALEEKHGVRS